MHKLVLSLVILFGLASALPATAANADASLMVSVSVLPAKQDRVQAVAPLGAVSRMENDRGEHWVVSKSADQAVKDYQNQMIAEGYQAVGSDGQRWKRGDTVVIVQARAAMSSSPISQLTLVAYRE